VTLSKYKNKRVRDEGFYPSNFNVTELYGTLERDVEKRLTLDYKHISWVDHEGATAAGQNRNYRAEWI
jgi:hypothetical protein